MFMAEFNIPKLKQEITAVLLKNIMPFWVKYAFDPKNDGFNGALLNNLVQNNEVPRSAILCTRLLWTFSYSARLIGNEIYRSSADKAFQILKNTFWDDTYGGFYWSVDQFGLPAKTEKFHYAQAFAIYGLSEYYRICKDPQVLNMAKQLFHLLESKAHDPKYGGYFEACDCFWNLLPDSRLSERDLKAEKSMNTMLHIMEAFTNLSIVWDDPTLKLRHKEVQEIFLQKIYDPEAGHLRLFFDQNWNPITDDVSYGHDIEASWLMMEAAELNGNPVLLEKSIKAAKHLAETTYQEGLDELGYVHYDGNKNGPFKDEPISWWPQVEGMVGFLNAYQFTAEKKYLHVVVQLWSFIRNFLVDQDHGDLYKQLNPDLSPDHKVYKLGPWEGPYHQVRAFLEVLHRLDILKKEILGGINE